MTSDLTAQRRAALYATVGALMVKRGPSVPELDLVHRWLDNWNGIGLVIHGMLRQEVCVDMSAAATTGWSVIILQVPPTGGAPDIVASAHDATPWRAVQLAAWNALDGKPMPGGRTRFSPATPTTQVDQIDHSSLYGEPPVEDDAAEHAIVTMWPSAVGSVALAVKVP